VKDNIGKAMKEVFKDENIRNKVSTNTKLAMQREDIKNKQKEGMYKIALKKLGECKKQTDLECFLDHNTPMVKRNCEVCGAEFYTSFLNRERAYCSLSCSNVGRYRTKRAVYSNHKVTSIEFCGYKDVYSGTVDEFHNFYIGHFQETIDGDKCYTYINTKQCGEQPLNSWESCNLGSINLTKYFSKRSEIYVSEKELQKDIETAVRFLDNVITVNKLPLPEIKETSDKTRKIGLGIMGWADLLTMAGIAYNSGHALRIAKKLMKFFKDCALEATHKLAKEKGAFPEFKNSIFKDEELRRNATLITIAPTGTLSMIADCSSGIEPNFSLAFIKTVMDGEKLIYANKYLEETLKKEEIYNKKLMQKIADNGGSLTGIEEIPNNIKKVFITSHEISWEYHIKMQSNFQQHVCNAVSKTINFAKSATKEDIDKAYKLAFEEGLKGITVYRDGSKENQVLSTSKSYDKKLQNQQITELIRPEVTIGKNYKFVTGCGGLFININETENGKPVELFATIGKSGNCQKCNMEALGRMVSLSFRNHIPVEKIIKQLLSIGCHKPCGMGPKKVLSCPDAIAKALKRYAEEKGNKEEVQKIINEEHKGTGACPECGGALEFGEGCVKCPQCGYTLCS
jgi:ribonucleoside-diphosphate reductase alpha chain